MELFLKKVDLYLFLAKILPAVLQIILNSKANCYQAMTSAGSVGGTYCCRHQNLLENGYFRSNSYDLGHVVMEVMEASYKKLLCTRPATRYFFSSVRISNLSNEYCASIDRISVTNHVLSNRSLSSSICNTARSFCTIVPMHPRQCR